MAEHGNLTNVSWSWGGTETTVAASLGDPAQPELSGVPNVDPQTYTPWIEFSSLALI